MKGQHRSAEYLTTNPKSKVPTLVVNGEALTENVAILQWLSERFPGAQLLPESNSNWAKAQQLADLAYCASGLHPIVTRLRIRNSSATFRSPSAGDSRWLKRLCARTSR